MDEKKNPLPTDVQEEALDTQTAEREDVGSPAEEAVPHFVVDEAGNVNQTASHIHSSELPACEEPFYRAPVSREDGKSRKGTTPLWYRALAMLTALMFFLAVTVVSGTVAYKLYKEERPSTSPGLNVNTTPYNEPASDGEALSAQQIAEKMKPSTVCITVETANGSGVGSGIIMTDDGYVLTNQHVVDGAEKITVITLDESRYPGKIVGQDEVADIAVVKIEASGLAEAEFGDSSQLRDGQMVVAIGTPSGVAFGWTVTVGHVSATERVLEVTTEGKLATSMKVMQHTAAINPGNSGGPLINMYGQVVGINTLKYGVGTLEGLGFAIPVSHVTDVVNDILEYGYVRGRPMIGITGADLTAYGAQMLGVPRGIEISFISPGTYAAESDLREGDIIIGVNGQEITSMNELNLVKNEHKAGDTLTLKVYRDGETLEIDVKLSEAQSQ